MGQHSRHDGLRVAVFGGDGRKLGSFREGIDVRYFPSQSHSNRGMRSLLSQIDRGDLDLVLLLTRWLGHPESWAVRDRCQEHNIRYRFIRSGMGEVRRCLLCEGDSQGLDQASPLTSQSSSWARGRSGRSHNSQPNHR